MHRILGWRVLLPIAAITLPLPYLMPAGRVALPLLPASALMVAAGIFVLTRRSFPDRRPFLCVTLSAAMLMVNNFESGVLRGGPSEIIGTTAAALSPMLFALGGLALLAARRPRSSRDGLLDGFAALLAVGALHWQWNAGAGMPALMESAALLVTISGSMFFAVVLAVLWRLVLDPHQNKVVALSMVVAGGLSGAGASATGTWAELTPVWAWSLGLFCHFVIIGVMLHPDSTKLFEPEPDHEKRLSLLRWLGPSSALIVGPAMMCLLLVRGESPSLPVALASILLTVVVLGRIGRLLREREVGRRELAIRERRFRSLVEHASDVILVTDRHGRITSLSGGVSELTGATENSLLGSHATDLLRDDGALLLRGALQHAGARGAISLARDVELARPDGQLRWVSIRLTDHLDDPDVRGWVLNLHDVTDRKLAEQALSQLALYDSLTGLPNRANLRDRLATLVATPGESVAVLFCDLDGFKAINDALGHEYGDEVLRSVGARWSSLLRADDVLGRWGGDEFLVLCSGVQDLADLLEIADRLLAAVGEPLVLTSGPARIGCSMGIAIHHAGESVDALVSRADAAMYEAKRAGGGHFCATGDRVLS